MNFLSLCAVLAKYLSCSYHPYYKFKLIFFSNRGIISHWKDYYSKNSEVIEARMFEWFNFLLYFTNSSWNLCCISNSFIYVLCVASFICHSFEMTHSMFIFLWRSFLCLDQLNTSIQFNFIAPECKNKKNTHLESNYSQCQFNRKSFHWFNRIANFLFNHFQWHLYLRNHIPLHRRLSSIKINK